MEADLDHLTAAGVTHPFLLAPLDDGYESQRNHVGRPGNAPACLFRASVVRSERGPSRIDALWPILRRAWQDPHAPVPHDLQSLRHRSAVPHGNPQTRPALGARPPSAGRPLANQSRGRSGRRVHAAGPSTPQPSCAPALTAPTTAHLGGYETLMVPTESPLAEEPLGCGRGRRAINP